jgi:hypothetical protein
VPGHGVKIMYTVFVLSHLILVDSYEVDASILPCVMGCHIR